MKKTIFKLLSLTLSLLLLCGSVFAASAGDFSDVAPDTWYREPVDFVAAMGLMNGTKEGVFSPKGTMDRAMFATILYRLAGAPQVEGECAFQDVSTDSYYFDAVIWASQTGVTTGISESAFAPHTSITREQMACMIARYALYIDAEFLKGPAVEQGFLDLDQVSDYAVEAVEIMRRTGLFRGDGAGNFRPRATATRAEAAMVFTRLSLALKKIPAQGILEVSSEDGENLTYTISQEDTIILYQLLTSRVWQERPYAEYWPTHVLELWGNKYLFDFGESPYFGFNMIFEGPDGTVQTGRAHEFEGLTTQLRDILAKYE